MLKIIGKTILYLLIKIINNNINEIDNKSDINIIGKDIKNGIFSSKNDKLKEKLVIINSKKIKRLI